ncbi:MULTISPECIES: DUF2316 family protein [Mammaliicoccus]|uniref:DUF2316 family protein n=1 Tax=Mammaliicoccus sciuri TaxID=1296 RepID=A0ABT7HVU9_MAMSC|nr:MULTISPECIES: DUF2316 family protein [Mammaliicoccus]MCJ0913721.1 DUF2316 family protein [Mammaliicoccus sciuri]MDL0111171.1 DUF2316 family protein [Mammaliicoccus sciuri]MDL0115769.1 DUF2316 family protein [Mammaliicoccus sciuri]WQJ64807.1 DUF2316 family protein [Mammaliicoccus sciuri]
MSLNKEQRKVTSKELIEHFKASHLTEEEIAEGLNVTPKDIHKALNMEAPNGLMRNRLMDFIHLVWDVRDFINKEIKAQGNEPIEYTYLKGNKEDYSFLQGRGNR